MKTRLRILSMAACGWLLTLTLHGCAGGSGVMGNSGGSEPVNEEEGREYKSQLLKCYKTGGSRIVKIEGQLRCY